MCVLDNKEWFLGYEKPLVKGKSLDFQKIGLWKQESQVDV